MKKVHIKNIDKLIALRELLDKKLYSGHALITYDLILDILKAHLGGRNLTIKELCAGSIRSTVNTRKHIDLLIDDGWIEISNGIHDKRHRIVNATEKLIHLVDTILAPSKAGSNVMNESMHLNCCQFRSTTKESFSIVNHCSNIG